MTSPPRIPPVPAVLRLVQMTVIGRWRATGEELYREVARLIEAGPGKEVLVSGCGDGVTAEWLAERTGAAVTGVDTDAGRLEEAESRARRAIEGGARRGPLTYQQGALDDLPHETAVFDCAIGEPALASASEPARAVAELARVTKPLGTVVLLQPTWSSEIGASVREMLVERLGLRPHLLVEWKQMLRDSGVVEIQVQDWTTGLPRTPGGTKNAIEAPQLTWQQKAQIVGRTWRRFGWGAGALRAGRDAVERETTLLRELSRERALGFQLIKGVKWPHATAT
jgi:SAM-dependent methyltransferase